MVSLSKATWVHPPSRGKYSFRMWPSTKSIHSWTTFLGDVRSASLLLWTLPRVMVIQPLQEPFITGRKGRTNTLKLLKPWAQSLRITILTKSTRFTALEVSCPTSIRSATVLLLTETFITQRWRVFKDASRPTRARSVSANSSAPPTSAGSWSRPTRIVTRRHTKSPSIIRGTTSSSSWPMEKF